MLHSIQRRAKVLGNKSTLNERSLGYIVRRRDLSLLRAIFSAGEEEVPGPYAEDLSKSVDLPPNELYNMALIDVSNVVSHRFIFFAYRPLTF